MRFSRKHNCEPMIRVEIKEETKPSGQLEDTVLKRRLTTRAHSGRVTKWVTDSGRSGPHKKT